MKKSERYVIINPRAERRNEIFFDARIPAESIRVGAVLRLPVNTISNSGRMDDQKVTAACEIIQIFQDKQLFLAAYKLQTRPFWKPINSLLKKEASTMKNNQRIFQAKSEIREVIS